jgi:hypothetical protein
MHANIELTDAIFIISKTRIKINFDFATNYHKKKKKQQSLNFEGGTLEVRSEFFCHLTKIDQKFNLEF